MSKLLDIQQILEEKGDREARRATRWMLNDTAEVLKTWAKEIDRVDKEQWLSCMMVACLFEDIVMLDSQLYFKENDKDYSEDESKEIVKRLAQAGVQLSAHYAYRLGIKKEDVVKALRQEQ